MHALSIQKCPLCTFAPIKHVPATNTGHTIKAAMLNCRSLRKHRTEIFHLLEDQNLNILFLTETWLDDHSDPDVIQALPPGYALARLDRKEGRGGGIAIATKDPLICTMSPIWVDHSEAGYFTINTGPNHSISGILIYRPPGRLFDFTDSLMEAITHLAIRKSRLLVLGDLNAHFEDPSDTDATGILAELISVQLELKNKEPSHQLGHLLDPVFGNWKGVHTAAPQPIPWSDHHIIPITIQLDRTEHYSQQSLRYKRRKWKNFSIEAFTKIVQDEGPPKGDDCETANKHIHNFVTKALDITAPMRSTTNARRTKKAAPWFSQELQTLKTACKKLERAWRQKFCPDIKAQYKIAQREYNKTIRLSKAAHYHTRIMEAENSSKELYLIYKEISIVNANLSSQNDSVETCNTIAQYFSGKIANIYACFSTNIKSATEFTENPNLTARRSA
ncbi:uncharacterized protein LOC144824948 [Lissotriton helveticus]